MTPEDLENNSLYKIKISWLTKLPHWKQTEHVYLSVNIPFPCYERATSPKIGHFCFQQLCVVTMSVYMHFLCNWSHLTVSFYQWKLYVTMFLLD